MASTRLRKTFHYPTDDSDSPSQPPALDEQEQETLITTLQNANQKSNDLYTHLFLLLPLLSTIAYIPLLFTPTQKLQALLSITSLTCTAYLLRALPPGKTGLDFVDQRRGDGVKTREQSREMLRYNARGPVLRYAPALNGFLGGLVLVLGVLVEMKEGGEHRMILKYLPIAIYAFTLLVKVVMGSVDVEELAELKYDYKGA